MNYIYDNIETEHLNDVQQQIVYLNTNTIRNCVDGFTNMIIQYQKTSAPKVNNPIVEIKLTD